MRIPKDRDEFEQKMLWAFSCGMYCGYGIDHENIHEEEEKAIKEFAERNGFKRKKVCDMRESINSLNVVFLVLEFFFFGGSLFAENKRTTNILQLLMMICFFALCCIGW